MPSNDEVIDTVSNTIGIDPRLMRAVLSIENRRGDPNAVSHPAPGQIQTPAHGLMQITPGTWKTVEPQVRAITGSIGQLSNPLHNLLGGAILWRKYLDSSQGNVAKAAAMYHGGENPRAWGSRTEKYAHDISDAYRAQLNQGDTTAPAGADH